MFLEFLDSGAVIDTGVSLGSLFAQFVAPRLQSAQGGAPHVMDGFFACVDNRTRDLRLGLYRKTRLAFAFKWTLLENGLDREDAVRATKHLFLHLALRLRADAGTGPAAADGEFLLSLGNEHLAGRRHAEAVACYRNAIELAPADPIAHNNLGAAFYAQGRLCEAEEQFRIATLLKQDYAEACSNRGNVLREMGRVADAESVLRSALKMRPEFPDALAGLGMALFLLGRFDEAEASYREALRIEPDNVGALVGAGQVAYQNGDFRAAEQLYLRALAICPKHPSAWAELVNLRKMTAADAAWLSAGEEIAQGGLAPVEEATLRFAIGKYCDDVGDFDRAFSNFHRANELRKLVSARYDAGQMDGYVDQAIRQCGSAWVERAAAVGCDSRRPVFVVGMMRSGTTLIEQIIASHRNAFGAGELGFWTMEATRRAGADGNRIPDKAWAHEVADRYLGVLSRFSPAAGRVVDKAPGNFAHLHLIHAAFPDAKIIHVCRDPIDTCLSIYFQNFSAAYTYASDLPALAHYYRAYHRLMEHWRATLPADAVLDVPYEALLSDPERWIGRMLGFIGLEWDERCLNFQDTKRRVGTASNWQVRQKLYKTSVQRWRNYARHIAPLMELADLTWAV